MAQIQEPRPDISAFLASAVHDMKNSIGILINLMEKHILELGPDTHEKTTPMLYEAKRINDNLIQILAVYKIGNQFYPFDLSENAIDDFAREIAEQSKTMLDYYGVALEIEVDEELSWYFDYESVFGVISHALNNATHYTSDKLRLSIKEENGELVMRVEDNGRGYPASVLEAGNAVSKGVNFTSGSTGLGLYFSSVVARLHKNRDKVGSIQLENGGKYGGSCFILRLP